MTEQEVSPRARRRAGLARLAGLLAELRALGPLRETRPGDFKLADRPLLHFHYEPGGRIVADVTLANGDVARFDVGEEGGQQELLSMIEGCLEDGA